MIYAKVLVMKSNKDKTIIKCYDENVEFSHKRYEMPDCDYFSVHTHNIFELIYIIEGDVTHVVEDKRYKLREGNLVLVRPFCYHFISIDTPKAYERYNIGFNAERLGFDMSKVSCDLNVLNVKDHPRLKEIFSKLDYYYLTFGADEFLDIFKGLLKEILYNLSLVESDESVHSSNDILSGAIEYINDNLFTIKDVKEISDSIFVTDSYLFKLFKKELHNSPKRYLTEKRLLEAQKQLALGEKPSKVFDECGFSDYTSFYRNYVKYFGHSPSNEKVK